MITPSSTNPSVQSLSHSSKSKNIWLARLVLDKLGGVIPTAPPPHKHLLSDCISVPISRPCFSSKSVPNCRDVHHALWHHSHPTYLQIFLNYPDMILGTRPQPLTQTPTWLDLFINHRQFSYQIYHPPRIIKVLFLP